MDLAPVTTADEVCRGISRRGSSSSSRRNRVNRRQCIAKVATGWASRASQRGTAKGTPARGSLHVVPYSVEDP